MARVDDTNSPRPTSNLLARGFRRARLLGGTALIGALAVGAVSFATGTIAANTVRIAVDEAATPLTVQVARIALQDTYTVPQDFIGVLEPRQDTGLGFESGGTLAEVLVDEGAMVAKGQVLARLDTRSLEAQKTRLEASRDALVAQVDLARLTYDRQKALADRSFASQQASDQARLTLAELEAHRAEAEAAIRETEIALDKAELRAPYAGIIAARLVDEGARVGAAAPIVQIQENAAPQVRIGLSPSVAARLAQGDQVEVRIDGTTYPAHFASRGSELNPVTRTVEVLFDLVTDTSTALPYGAVARLTVTHEVAERGTWLPLSALSEGPRGLWTVLYVDQGQVVREAVEVLYANETAAFLRGAIPDGAQVITSGTHRVAPGQTVRASEV